MEIMEPVVRSFSLTNEVTQQAQQSLPSMLTAVAEAEPNLTAVIDQGTSYSFTELVEQAQQMALFLQNWGICEDGFVGIYAHPSWEMMTGIWGALFSGGAYVPLSPEYPDERLDYMLNSSKLSMVVVQKSLIAQFKAKFGERVKLVTLEDAQEFYRKNRAHLQLAPNAFKPNRLAYVIYTSGSTGKPKGVMIEHASIVHQMQWLHDHLAVDRNHRILQKTPMSFDAAQWEILSPCLGVSVVVGEPNLYKNPAELIAVIKDHAVTTLQCVPTLLQALINEDGAAECTTLKYLFSGGEALSVQLAKACTQFWPSVELVNLYGPTECTINASAKHFSARELRNDSGSVAIGLPVTECGFHIVNEQGAACEAGEVGELFISGPQLARGYYGQPELTAERFLTKKWGQGGSSLRVYKTGDLAFFDDRGDCYFVGRTDSQVKLRGYRVELDEIRLAIEAHQWVKYASVFTKKDERTGYDSLIACVQLDENEAALMDQGRAGLHHQSKKNKLQVKAQLSNKGCRSDDDLIGRTTLFLPGKQDDAQQRQLAFRRKTYRTYAGQPLAIEPVTDLLTIAPPLGKPHVDAALSLANLSQILRFFGAHFSDQRLLPKYAFASPGALNATQIYLEINNVADVDPGIYYFHPVKHSLVKIAQSDAKDEPLRLHFMGKNSAIKPVYKNNIREVLEFEVGHILGLADFVLPGYGLQIGSGWQDSAIASKLDCAADDLYLGSYIITDYGNAAPQLNVQTYLQTHDELLTNTLLQQTNEEQCRLWQLNKGGYSPTGSEIVRKKDVIAINQRTYQDSQFGVLLTVEDHEPWDAYIQLGRRLQHLQMNEGNIGLMSSGYSSKSGAELPSAVRMKQLLADAGKNVKAAYFAVAGPVSEEQTISEDMREDAVHMQGPVEILRGDLESLLPQYMIPNQISLVAAMPYTNNGKIDHKSLAANYDLSQFVAGGELQLAQTDTEKKIADIWGSILMIDEPSINDDFFAVGGNSLLAVSLVKNLSQAFNQALPLQTLFEANTIAALAELLTKASPQPSSRVIKLNQGEANAQSVYCWPGLGGYPMSLRTVARQLPESRAFYGVQALGINQGEPVLTSIQAMAERDIQALRAIQPQGPYALWGYSFGARVAFEVAHQLEQAGEVVSELVLIAPGSPKLSGGESEHGRRSEFDNPLFITLLQSVFTRKLDGDILAECLTCLGSQANFIEVIEKHFPQLGRDIIERIVTIVVKTYAFEYTFEELLDRELKCPIAILKATGDDYSFLDQCQGYAALPVFEKTLAVNHFDILEQRGMPQLMDHYKSWRANFVIDESIGQELSNTFVAGI